MSLRMCPLQPLSSGPWALAGLMEQAGMQAQIPVEVQKQSPANLRFQVSFYLQCMVFWGPSAKGCAPGSWLPVYAERHRAILHCQKTTMRIKNKNSRGVYLFLAHLSDTRWFATINKTAGVHWLSATFCCLTKCPA